MANVFGLEVADLPEEWTPIECVVILKCFAPDVPNGILLDLRCTEGIMLWDIVGMLRSYASEAEKRFAEL